MKSLIVSLHDVSPLTFAAGREILRDLAEAGISTTSLLVIPNHHRRGHFLEDPEFCSWLRTMAEAGHEIVTHGYFHQRERNVRESIREKMITRFYTANEGEFYDITEAEALEKMQRAQLEFQKLDIHPVGFIAPAWLLSQAGEQAARRCGFRYTTTLGEIRHLTSGTVHRSQSLVYSVRSSWRRISSLLWNPFLASRLAENSIIRLGIHPPDWRHPNIRKQILRLSRSLAPLRRATTYADFVSP